MNRYKLHDRKVHADQKFGGYGGSQSGCRWAVLDTTTNRIVDEGSTRYEAQQAVNGWNDGVYTEDQPEPERVIARAKTAMEAADAAAADPSPAVHRFITAQDTTTPRVLVTYDAPDGRQTTERVSIHLADLLYDRGLGDYDSAKIETTPTRYCHEAGCSRSTTQHLWDPETCPEVAR